MKVISFVLTQHVQSSWVPASNSWPHDASDLWPWPPPTAPPSTPWPALGPGARPTPAARTSSWTSPMSGNPGQIIIDQRREGKKASSRPQSNKAQQFSDGQRASSVVQILKEPSSILEQVSLQCICVCVWLLGCKEASNSLFDDSSLLGVGELRRPFGDPSYDPLG